MGRQRGLPGGPEPAGGVGYPGGGSASPLPLLVCCSPSSLHSAAMCFILQAVLWLEQVEIGAAGYGPSSSPG